MATIPDDRLAAWRAFLEAHAAVTEVLAAELAEAQDLPLTWYDVLVTLAEADGRRVRMQELAGRILLSKSGLTRLVQRMEDAGLVERLPCDDDGRGIWAALTDEGMERLRAASPVHLDGVARHFGDLLSPSQIAPVTAVMQRVTRAAKQASSTR